MSPSTIIPFLVKKSLPSLPYNGIALDLFYIFEDVKTALHTHCNGTPKLQDITERKFFRPLNRIENSNFLGHKVTYYQYTWILEIFAYLTH